MLSTAVVVLTRDCEISDTKRVLHGAVDRIVVAAKLMNITDIVTVLRD